MGTQMGKMNTLIISDKYAHQIRQMTEIFIIKSLDFTKAIPVISIVTFTIFL